MLGKMRMRASGEGGLVAKAVLGSDSYGLVGAACLRRGEPFGTSLDGAGATHNCDLQQSSIDKKVLRFLPILWQNPSAIKNKFKLHDRSDILGHVLVFIRIGFRDALKAHTKQICSAPSVFLTPFSCSSQKSKCRRPSGDACVINTTIKW